MLVRMFCTYYLRGFSSLDPGLVGDPVSEAVRGPRCADRFRVSRGRLALGHPLERRVALDVEQPSRGRVGVRVNLCVCRGSERGTMRGQARGVTWMRVDLLRPRLPGSLVWRGVSKGCQIVARSGRRRARKQGGGLPSASAARGDWLKLVDNEVGTRLPLQQQHIAPTALFASTPFPLSVSGTRCMLPAVGQAKRNFRGLHKRPIPKFSWGRDSPGQGDRQAHVGVAVGFALEGDSWALHSPPPRPCWPPCWLRSGHPLPQAPSHNPPWRS